jgi:hypothetical protein
MARRHSLLVRLLLVSAVISACSIAATAWLATRTTTGSIERQQGKSEARDALIYDALIGFAATHRNWTGVQSTVDTLARETGRRIVLTTGGRQRIADSAGTTGELPTAQSRTVDPLTPLIDPRAVGPYRLTDDERSTLRIRLTGYAACAQRHGVALTVDGGGRPTGAGRRGCERRGGPARAGVQRHVRPPGEDRAWRRRSPADPGRKETNRRHRPLRPTVAGTPVSR